MAIQMDLTLEAGEELPNAYLKIASMVINLKGMSSVDIHMDVYKNEEDGNNLNDVKDSFLYNASGENFINWFALDIVSDPDTNHIRQAYLWLMTLPDYDGAIEV
jgi:hypothetical protein